MKNTRIAIKLSLAGLATAAAALFFVAGWFFGGSGAPQKVVYRWPVPGIVTQVKDSVVTINILGGSDPHQRSAGGSGSGFIFGPGYVVTNYHVVNDSKRVQVTYSDGRKEMGRVKGHDYETDLAVIKVDRRKLKPLSLGNSAGLRVGAVAIAVGSPQYLDVTVTSGIISALNRNVTTTERTYIGLIQTDASINPGSSGGPLLDIEGRAIGVTTLVGGNLTEGIGFALPIDQVKWVVKSIIEGAEVEHAFGGMSFADLNQEQAEQAGISHGYGAVILFVTEKKPADVAGIRMGDIVVEADGEQIKNANHIVSVIRDHRVGDKLTLRIKRNSRVMTKILVLAPKPRPK